MCLARPHRVEDYFCSETCKEESMQRSSSVEISNSKDHEDYQLQLEEVQSLTTI